MKNIILISFIVITLNNDAQSQLPQDYPFKIILDDEGNAYMTGEINGNLFAQRFNSSGTRVWSKEYINPGFDRGMDIKKGSDGNILVAGYVTNQIDGKYDIVLVKFLNNNPPQILWSNIFERLYYDEQAFAIIPDLSGNIYLTGYEYYKNYKKNLKILKLNEDNADILKDTSYNNKVYNGDDVGIDILIDRGFLYVLGYTYNGHTCDNDVIQLTYGLRDTVTQNLKLEDALTIKNKGRETPTSFIISDFAESPIQKSRTSMTVLSDNMGFPGTKDYLIMTLCGSSLIWKSRFDGNNLDDVPASISVNDTNLYVTGYSYRNQNNSDIATIKYSMWNGNYTWNDSAVRYIDNGGGKDKGSSIKAVNDSIIYVAGTSELLDNGFFLMKYNQSNFGIVDPAWERTFSPEISNTPVYRSMKKVSLLELDSNDFIYHINYAWNETEKYYFIIKYDSDGEQIYIIDNIPDEPADGNFSEKKSVILNNYPNPFNPSTKIKYELKKPGFIELKVYDVTGKEVAELVSENQHTGIYEKEFHSNRLPSGVYFYTLYADGVKMDTKKCLLVR